MSTNGENGVQVAVPAHEPEPPQVVRRRRLLVWGTAIAVSVILAAPLLVQPGYDAKTVPSQLVGEWTSSHPEYSDRYITMTPTSITFGVGGTSSVKYKVMGMIKAEDAEDNSVELFFQGVGGTEFKKSIVVKSSGDEMYFASQPTVVWQRYGS
jgi:hypothetical protein